MPAARFAPSAAKQSRSKVFRANPDVAAARLALMASDSCAAVAAQIAASCRPVAAEAEAGHDPYGIVSRLMGAVPSGS